jgi:hypothetical protein
MTNPRFFKWLFSWRTVRRLLVGIACLVTLWALFCTEEDIRGKHAWDSYRRNVEARGENLDFQAFIPKPVPDDQNFAATPFIRSWFVRSNHVFRLVWKGDNYGQAEAHTTVPGARVYAPPRNFLDLVAWSRAFDVIRAGKMTDSQNFVSGKLDLGFRAKAAPSVLEGLKTNDAAFAELRAASQRPFSRYPIEYDLDNPSAILLPHLINVRQGCRRLMLKASAELVAGQSQDALEDVKLALFMADSLKEEPFIISYLVRVACLLSANQPVWEGLAEHAWSDTQLQELETRLQQGDLVSDAKRSLESERACGVTTIELVRKKGLGYLGDLGSDTPSPPLPADHSVANFIGLFVPRGWYYLEKYNYCRLFDTLLGSGIDATKKRISPGQLASGRREFDLQFNGGRASNIFHHRFMSAMLLPAVEKFVGKATQAQTIANQAAVACALERYRLADGQFPNALDALVPRFISQLPHDVITGEPYKYRRSADGQFVLYSVGWNEKDDGGVPGKTLFDEEEGDWVWRYPSP